MGYKFLENFADVKRRAEKNLAPFAVLIAKKLNVDKICIVGGAVRDAVLAAYANENFHVKDFDVICYAPPKLSNNENILSVQKNSFGGDKINLRDIGMVDSFQFYTPNPANVIAQYFDFNCNSLFFHNGKIQMLPEFVDFMRHKTITVCNANLGLPEHFVVRAVKFKIVFNSLFGLNASLDEKLLCDLRGFTSLQMETVKDYAHRKIKQPEILNSVLDFCSRVRSVSL